MGRQGNTFIDQVSDEPVFDTKHYHDPETQSTTSEASGSSVEEETEDVSPVWSEEEESNVDDEYYSDDLGVEGEDWELADGGMSPILFALIQISPNTTTA